MGPRAGKLNPIRMSPGFYTNAADGDAPFRYKAGDNVRFRTGFPEKIGGSLRLNLTGVNGGLYIGTARSLLDWTSLDNQKWVAIGTHNKLYVINSLTLYDITPIRKSSNLVDPFTTINGSPTVTVADPDHRANVGDYVFVTASAAVGGLTLAGYYPIVTIPTAGTYTITAGSNASSDATGGGNVTLSYDIYAGLAENGELLGYGTGTYGSGTYGTPRTPGSGVLSRMRIWSLVQWGEDLVAAPSGGEVYWWQRSNGANSRAKIVSSAPRNVNWLVMDKENKVLIALGCTGFDGIPDAMRLRWTNRELLEQWTPDPDDASNTAGGRRLDYGSRLVTGIGTRKLLAIWSDTTMYIMQNIGDDYAIDPVGKMQILGPLAAVDANGVVYAMGIGGIHRYDGVLVEVPCDVWSEVFDHENAADPVDITQGETAQASYQEQFSEVRWQYKKVSGAIGYLIYNIGLNCWYTGERTRTAMAGDGYAFEDYRAKPYAVNNGRVYIHEVGADDVDGVTTTPLDFYLETHDLTQSADSVVMVNSVVPKFDALAVGLRYSLKRKMKPQEAYVTKGPYEILTTTTESSPRCRGSQICMRIEARRDGGNNVIAGQTFRLGVWQADGIGYGSR